MKQTFEILIQRQMGDETWIDWRRHMTNSNEAFVRVRELSGERPGVKFRVIERATIDTEIVDLATLTPSNPSKH